MVSNIVKFLLKIKDGRDGRLFWLFEGLAMLQLKPWSAKGASYHPAIMSNYHSHVFSLIHQVDEYYFKEMSTWGQSKISSRV